jgi:sporulation protein YqfC
MSESLIHITNYKNIVDIGSNRILILLNNKELIINGCNLYISALDKYEILIKGNIKGLEFNEK